MDVGVHLAHQGLSEDTVLRIYASHVDGSLLLRIDEEDLLNDFSLDDKEVQRCLEIISRLKASLNGQNPGPIEHTVDFWAWRCVYCAVCKYVCDSMHRALNTREANFYCKNMFSMPRLMLAYIYTFDYDTLSLMLTSPPHPLRPVNPPQADNLIFWVLALVSPNTLVRNVYGPCSCYQ